MPDYLSVVGEIELIARAGLFTIQCSPRSSLWRGSCIFCWYVVLNHSGRLMVTNNDKHSV